jgi:pimeloyl-ACP methyl ester carboxylesterase
MKLYNKVLKTRFNTDINEKHIGSQYQPQLINKQPITKNSEAIRLNAMTDVEGLDRAYARDNGIYIRNNTVFVSGTQDFPQDHWDDLKIPFNLTAESLRYRNADKALNTNELLNPEQQITSLVGHSLGGSVILEMQKQYPDRTFKTTTYGAPVKSISTPDNIDNKRFRNIGDPVSILDRGATNAVKPSLLMNLASLITDNNTVNTSDVILQALDNHSYDGFGNKK